MKVVAFIPARGGSKRIPRKNLAEVGGVSLVVRAIDHAAAAGGFRWIVVSTDDAEIVDAVGSRIAQRCRDSPPGQTGWSLVEIHHRPPELAADGSQIEDAIAHWAETADDWDAMVLLQPTSPLRRPETIRACLAGMDRDGDDTGELHTVQVRRLYDHEGRMDLGTHAWDCGAVYAFTRDFWERHRCRYMYPAEGLEVDRFEAWEIDEPLDLVVCEALLAAREVAP